MVIDINVFNNAWIKFANLQNYFVMSPWYEHRKNTHAHLVVVRHRYPATAIIPAIVTAAVITRQPKITSISN